MCGVFKMKQQTENPFKERPPLDPLDIAKAEGNVYGKGIKGGYKKTFITRLGFLLIILPFLTLALVIIFFTFQSFGKGPFETFILKGILLIFGTGIIYFFGKMALSAVRK